MWLRMLHMWGRKGRREDVQCTDEKLIRTYIHTLDWVDICYDWICTSTIADPLCGICEYFKHCSKM